MIKHFFITVAVLLFAISASAQQENLTLPDSASSFFRSDFKANSGYPPYIINGRGASFHDMLEYVSSSEEATKYIKRAKFDYVATLISGFSAAGFLTWGILNYYNTDKIDPAIVSVAGLSLASTFFFQYSFKRHSYKAIYKFHPELEQQNQSPALGLFLRPNGLGLALRF
ncbi:hypothetical protein [Sediminitomix flava]|uniref:Uncharacterized protein n=1 Tax=Sediminitomix flava TaxID=379075 RepID=A0A315Z0L0_SEDFL|nr:hypothetical protein [Sediminitomix flava]PWJ36168.1 hypothetical protein BC781_109187 [Sediminitomix flava]